MINTEVHALFPTPVMITNLDRKFTEEEIIFFKEHSHYKNLDKDNQISKDKFILDQLVLNALKNKLTTYISLYLKNITNPISKISLYITQSWLNYMKPGVSHHLHSHPNSFVSGILYINANENIDSIDFHKPSHYNPYAIYPKEWNTFNSLSWNFPVKTGMLILFPSELGHSVANKNEQDTRISLVFNTFLKGSIGTVNNLNSLTL